MCVNKKERKKEEKKTFRDKEEEKEEKEKEEEEKDELRGLWVIIKFLAYKGIMYLSSASRDIQMGEKTPRKSRYTYNVTWRTIFA